MLRVVLYVIALAAIVSSYGYYELKKTMVAPFKLPEPQLVEVPSGVGFNNLCKLWQSNGWVEECWRLKLVAKLDPSLTDIKAGMYKLVPGTALGAFRQVSQGQVHEFTFTIIEGDALHQVLKRLSQAPYLQNPLAWGDKFAGKELTSELEGQFYPDTYYYHAYESAEDVLRRAYNKMNNELDLAWQKRSEDIPLKSPYEALILASIIEKETALVSESPLIGSVFVNRLNKGMRLQTDPTVIYGIGPDFNGDITHADLRKKTPYNTYRIDGLPPTPIAMPSKRSLLAAVNPQQSDYYYFVARGDGSHHFSTHLTEHNRAVRHYLLKDRNDG